MNAELEKLVGAIRFDSFVWSKTGRAKHVRRAKAREKVRLEVEKLAWAKA